MPEIGAGFNSLPWPVQKMLMDRMYAEQQARRQAGASLYGMFPEGAQPQQQPQFPPPPQKVEPPMVAPPPGAMSPGGGNPAAQGGTGPPPALTAGAQPAAPQIQPFRSLPSAPAGQPTVSGGDIPSPPSAEAAAESGVNQPKPFDLRSIVGGLRKSGVPSEKVMDMLDQLTSVMSAANRQELDILKTTVNAERAAAQAYKAVHDAEARQREVKVKEEAEQSRRAWRSQSIELMKARAAALAGGTANLKLTEIVYPKDAQGRADETQDPIGTRNVTKTGKIIYMDPSGRQVPSLSGATAKESKDTKGSASTAVRTNIVKAGITNALARLNEIEKTFGDTATTSSFFGQHGDNPATRALYGAARSGQSAAQQTIDAKWASFIDEAIPVFTGGLRGSDAFRRFLIEQAPALGDKPATVKEKRRLFRQNIEGTSKAFFNKFSSDPSFWGPGVTADEVKGSGGAVQQPTGEWKVEKVSPGG